jgi:hypothetical protein
MRRKSPFGKRRKKKPSVLGVTAPKDFEGLTTLSGRRWRLSWAVWRTAATCTTLVGFTRQGLTHPACNLVRLRHHDPPLPPGTESLRRRSVYACGHIQRSAKRDELKAERAAQRKAIAEAVRRIVEPG